MTKDEAYREMTNGHRITHRSFAADEYLYMNHVISLRRETEPLWSIFDECGYNWGHRLNEPWTSRSGGSWETGWSIYTGVVK